MLKTMFKTRAEKIADMDLPKNGMILTDAPGISPESLRGKGDIEIHNNSSIDALRYALEPELLQPLIESRVTCDFCGEWLENVYDENKNILFKVCSKHGKDFINYTLGFKDPYENEREQPSEGICTGEDVKALKTENLKPEENNTALLQEEIERISRERDLWKLASELFFQALKDARDTNSTAGASKRFPPV